jgi:hypothetical protein
MRWAFLACAFLIAGLLEAQQPKAESGPASLFPGAVAQGELCTVEGRTVEVGTDKVLRGVRLTLQVGGERLSSPGIEVPSDSQGRFRFAGLRPGSYILLGARQDYATFAYRAPITLSPGQNFTGLVLHLVRAGRIKGKVVDDGGKRVGYAGVVAIPAGSSQASPVDGRTVVRGGADRSGNFALPNLQPGQYLVWASPVPLQPARPSEEAAAGMSRTATGKALRSTYYPSAAEAGSATRLEVLPGKTLSGIKVGLRKGSVYLISGRTVNTPANVSYKSLVVRLRSLDAPWRWPGVSVQPDGGFIVRDVEPGNYDVYLEETITRSYVGPYGGASAIEGGRRRGHLTVAVTDKDITGVTLSY